MLKRLVNSLLGRPATVPAVRRFDGATGGRRGKGFGSFDDINAEIATAGWALRRRSLYQARNNAWVVNGINAWVTGLIGAGIKPKSSHPDAAVRELLHKRFRAWTDTADADNLTDFYGLQALACRGMAEAGEGFAQLLHGEAGLQVRLLGPDMVPADLTRELGDGRRIVQGVEFAADGRRVAYHVRRHRPIVPSFPYELVRIPADQMVHMFLPLADGQVRGVPWTAPVALRAHEADILEDAAIEKQKIAALFAAFLYDPNGSTGAQFNGTVTGGVMDVSLEPGTTKALPPGYDIKFADPPEADPIVELLKLELRGIAAGLGVPEFLVTGDMSQANYSSLRGALVEFRARIEQIQYGVVVHQLLRPIWRAWVLNEVMAGRLAGDPDELLPVEWITPAQRWVDPEADVKAAVAMVDAGFASRAQVVAGLGWDIEQLDAEIAADSFRSAAQPKETPVAG